MGIHELIALIAALATLGTLMMVAVRPSLARAPSWAAIALLSVIFMLLSLLVIWREGPTGFWPLHTANFWGNQVWVDLLMAAGLGFFLMANEARQRGMNLVLWAVVVLASGSIGLFAMAARLFYLRQQSA